jgi:hypothetical protein
MIAESILLSNLGDLMNIKQSLALLILSALISGCNSIKVTTDVDKAYDFTSAKTYQWIPGPTKILEQKDTFLREDIQAALNKEIMKVDLQPVETTEKADLQIAYYVKLKEYQEYSAPPRRDEREFSGGFVYNRDEKGWNYAEREPDLNVYNVEVGTLTLLVYDAKTGKRVWKGTLKTKLDRSKSQEIQRPLIQVAAEKIITKFSKAQRKL